MIELKEITYENFVDVLKLRVEKDQEDFVASNSYSLAEAYCSLKESPIPDTPLAIVHEEEVVGFLMYEYCGIQRDDGEDDDEYLQETPYYHLFRYMVDKKHQGKGYGRLAMERLIEHIKTKPQGEADGFFICYCPENGVAKKFYESFGFVDTGQVIDDENIMRLAI